MCEDTFTCGSEIHILSYVIPGEGWFIFMLIIALALQIAANFIWIQSSQASRELLQKPKNQRGSAFDFNSPLGRNVLWTIVSTIIWIGRIILVMGSNIYIFIIVLLGNVIGVIWTNSRQKRDHINYLADDIFLMVQRKNTCDTKTREKIQKALKALKEELHDVAMAERYQDNPDPEQIRF